MPITPVTIPEGKFRIKNTLPQTLPIQLFEKQTDPETGEEKTVTVQSNMTRKETREIDSAQVTPALQSQINSRIVKVRK